MTEEIKKVEVKLPPTGTIKTPDNGKDEPIIQCSECKRFIHIDQSPEDFSSITKTQKCIECIKKKPEPEKPITDFKVAEIWIRNGRLMLDALPEFWKDKIRALGVLELCKDIVKEAKLPDESRIIKGQDNHKFWNFVRGLGKRKK